MQPGNNYRAGASVLVDTRQQATQAMADALNQRGAGWSGYSTPLVWSKMLTVWRKLHVETDTMVRPIFSQNTFTMAWNDPAEGPVASQVVFDVDDPLLNPFQTDTEQFTQGYVELRDSNESGVVVARIIQYTNNPAGDDAVLINLPDCGGGQSGLDCLGGVENGNATLSDDDISDQSTFTAKVWGCDDAYSGPVASLFPPDLSKLQERYQPAYIDPVQDTGASAVQGLVTFLRNVDFGDNYGKVLWDQARAARDLPISATNFWTAMTVSGWRAEEPEDGDPNSEDQVGIGITKGINTHNDGSTDPAFGLDSSYTGLIAVFKAVFGEVAYADFEKYTVVHEMGHTLGLAHSDGGAMCEYGDCQREPFTAVSLKKLRSYDGP